MKEAGELKRVFRLPVLGHIESSRRRCKGLDKWIYSMQRRTRPPYDKLGYAQKALCLLDDKQIVLCLEPGDVVVEEMAEVLTAGHQEIRTGGYVQNDAEALAMAKESGGVVLLVRVMRTRRFEVKRSLETCKVQGIKVLGVIVIS